MSIATVIQFPDVKRFPPLLALTNGVQRPEIRKVMGRAVATLLRRHFTKLDKQRANKLGGKRTHFYGQARRSVQQPELVAGDGVKVAINHVGIAQRFFGGLIRARPGSKLTIPVHPAAYGKRAREFSDLDAIYFDDGDGILARPNAESPNGIGEVYYRLLSEVDQKEDPAVLPTEEEQLEAALGAGEQHVRTLIGRQGGYL